MDAATKPRRDAILSSRFATAPDADLAVRFADAEAVTRTTGAHRAALSTAYDITRGGINEAAYLPRACRDLGTAKIATLVENKLTDFCPRNQPSISHSTKHHGVLRLCGDARGAAYTRE
jgi:hypothetical protein